MTIIRSNYIFDTITKTTFAGFIQIEKGLIKKIGPLVDIPQGEVIDYSEQMIIPSFIDCHVHFYLSALIHAGHLIQLSGISEQEFAQQVPALPTTHGWKLGIGWFSSDFGQNVYPTKNSIDTVCSDVPVMLISGDAHSIWLNTKAIEVLQITKDLNNS